MNSSLEEFLKSPWVTAVGWFGGICSIIAIPLAFYSTMGSPDLTYYYSVDDKVKIIGNNEVSQLHIFHDEVDGEIRDELYLIKIRVWNAGKEPIRIQDIRTKLTIKSTPAINILEAKVNDTNGSAVNFQVDTLEKSKGEIGLLFDVLEKDEGGTIQLLYIGGKEVEFVINGKVIGQDEIKSWIYHMPALTIINPIFYISVAMSGLFLSLFLIERAYSYCFIRNGARKTRYGKAISLIMLSSIFITLITTLIMTLWLFSLRTGFFHPL